MENNIEYTKEEINTNTELQKELLKQLKKEHYRERAREWRTNNRALVNEYNRNYQRKKYQEDTEFRVNRFEYQRIYNNRRSLKNNPLLPTLSRGRPSIFKLNDTFQLLVNCK